jgi:hypothetical protein
MRCSGAWQSQDNDWSLYFDVMDLWMTAQKIMRQ